MADKCTKQNSYETPAAARRAILRIPEKASGQIPFRFYWCKQHKAFHLSSKAQHKRKGQELCLKLSLSLMNSWMAS
jgi:hypothetical protein